jgi:hypothetical protein
LLAIIEANSSFCVLAKLNYYKKLYDENINLAYLTWDERSDGAKDELRQVANIVLTR